jgi:hypothetical protein
MTRTEIINHLIIKFGYTNYLEIGVRNPEDNLLKVIAINKDGVDPAGGCNFEMTSDHFFELLPQDSRYDIVFIDGLHQEAQVDRDIANALKHLSPGGSIVVHDCNPIAREHQSEEYNGGIWNGTTWKAFAKLRISNPNLEMVCVDTDHGVGIIRAGSQTVFGLHSYETLDYDFLAANRHSLLNLISEFQFVSRFIIL